MNITIQYPFLLLSYLLGAIPFGYILTRYFTGKNILEIGSGNVGSTNVGRVAGKKIAIATQLLDMLKGFAPVAVYLFFIDDKKIGPDFFVYCVSLATIIGHDFSIFLKFKGGKGVNTTLGASVLIAPFSVFISVAIYFIIKWRLKYVSLGSIILGIALPITELFIHGLSSTFYYLLICMVLIILLHRTNINRLLHNEELSS
ncbi:glycerol-3-phosphate 1-O-acyltransferase PlsY [Labilibaculum antarcticum]|uniref:Glycerol-3-phosphate acyltransferase n=1 Tax=Labilibaculum antarcticum TaxID=1717717 RepID=A0A1Y1CMC0_9BACT|nr:glycerol-3-phosphate 1-O-acyltransferase PlsY [Labilibaculum antarcticum]BAX81440.1 acyl-phosphate glycerol 3-phosphate acyltransferase [Labilibaculum antarcticum]